MYFPTVSELEARCAILGEVRPLRFQFFIYCCETKILANGHSPTPPHPPTHPQPPNRFQKFSTFFSKFWKSGDSETRFFAGQDPTENVEMEHSPEVILKGDPILDSKSEGGEIDSISLQFKKKTADELCAPKDSGFFNFDWRGKLQRISVFFCLIFFSSL